ncbi:S-adenosyl-L-methionine-dependent methyltransferase [Acephala macrosclerotiorum]|nr:S-adenosyl-L-methionine-dependent methyltransferase [Acephala macrosclerotiorum]
MDNEISDRDSTFEDGPLASSTTSIGSSILKYREENGRTYHAYKDGNYLRPNDELEQERLDLQHHLFTLTFDGKLFTCPVAEEKQIHRVLDVGTGTGIWAIDFADEHPEAQVLGIDLSPIQPKFIPPNVSFEVDDAEDAWTFSQKFDFIYSRAMTGTFTDWPRFFQQSFEYLTPGGYIELADACFPILTDDQTLPTDSALLKWSRLILEAGEKIGRPTNSAASYKLQLENAGFVNVVEFRYKWPLNRWPKDAKSKELGMWTLENFTSGLSAFSMAFFTRVLEWSKAEVEVFLVDVRREMNDKNVHAYCPIYVVYGQKPS